MTLEKLRENIKAHTPYVMQGYDKYVQLSKVMSDIDKKHLIVRKSNGKLYLDINYKDLCDTFTEEEAREQLDWIIPHMERVD